MALSRRFTQDAHIATKNNQNLVKMSTKRYSKPVQIELQFIPIEKVVCPDSVTWQIMR